MSTLDARVPEPGGSADPVLVGPTGAAANLTVVFRRPRLLRTLLVPVGLLATVAGLLVATRSAAGLALAAAVCVTGGVVLGRGASLTCTEVGTGGIVDRSPFRTRRWAWEQVHEVIAPTRRSGISLGLVDGKGARHLLVHPLAARGDQRRLERLARAATRLAAAPWPGPDRAAVRRRTAGIVALGLVVTLLTAVLFGLLLTPTGAPVGASSRIDCPEPVSWLLGERYPGCGTAVRGRAVGGAAVALLDGLSAAGIAAVARSRHRLARGRGAARRLPGHGDQ